MTTTIKRHAALYNYPRKRNSTPLNDLVLGNVDGNILKLIYMLLRENIITLSQDDYQTLVKLYLQHTGKKKSLIEKLFFHHNTDTDLICFIQILKKIKVINRPDVHLFGHELVGNGYNDYLSLLLLEHLAQEKLPFDIILSNNDSEFICLFEKYYHMDKTIKLWSESAPSLFHLLELIRDQKISVGDVRELVHTAFYPRLKLIDYIVDKDAKKIYIFLNAPNGFETIKAIADSYALPFSTSSIETITNTIDAINDRAHESLLKNTFSEQIDINLLNSLDERDPLPLDKPIMRLLWNLSLDDTCQHDARGDYEVQFLHTLGSDSLYLHKEIQNLRILEPETQTDNHYEYADAAFSYTVLHSDAPIYESDYVRFIKLVNKLNDMIPKPSHQAYLHVTILELLKACHLDVLAHLDRIDICRMHINILEETIKLLSAPSTENLVHYLKLLNKVSTEKLSPALPSIHFKMANIYLRFNDKKPFPRKEAPEQLKQKQDVSTSPTNGMLTFSNPLRHISSHPKKKITNKEKKHVHFESNSKLGASR